MILFHFFPFLFLLLSHQLIFGACYSIDLLGTAVQLEQGNEITELDLIAANLNELNKTLSQQTMSEPHSIKQQATSKF